MSSSRHEGLHVRQGDDPEPRPLWRGRKWGERDSTGQSKLTSAQAEVKAFRMLDMPERRALPTSLTTSSARGREGQAQASSNQHLQHPRKVSHRRTEAPLRLTASGPFLFVGLYCSMDGRAVGEGERPLHPAGGRPFERPSGQPALAHNEIGSRRKPSPCGLRGFPLPVGEGASPSPSGGRWPRSGRMRAAGAQKCFISIRYFRSA